MKVLGVPSKSGGTVSVRREQLTLVARLIPTFRLLSKSVMAKCKGDLWRRYTLYWGVESGCSLRISSTT